MWGKIVQKTNKVTNKYKVESWTMLRNKFTRERLIYSSNFFDFKNTTGKHKNGTKINKNPSHFDWIWLWKQWDLKNEIPVSHKEILNYDYKSPMVNWRQFVLELQTNCCELQIQTLPKNFSYLNCNFGFC